jgi:hypothetical protein
VSRDYAQNEEGDGSDRSRRFPMKTEPTDVLGTWGHVQDAVVHACLGSLHPVSATQQWRALACVGDSVAETMCATATAALHSQAGVARDWAERIAADPRSSKLVVEGAHQGYDLIVAYAEASSAWCGAWLAIVRSIEPAWPASGGRRSAAPPSSEAGSTQVARERR